MQRRLLALVTLLLGGLLLAPALAPALQEAGKKVSLKVLLPERTAKLSVDGKAVGGEGDTRAVAVTTDKGAVKVEATWDPNGYTKITRRRTVAVKGTDEITVDLRKADAKEKDDIVVIYVPTPDDVVEAMCKLGRVTKEDVVYDLGCGDGRMVITAVKKFGAKRGVGVDIDEERVRDSKANAKKAGVDDLVEFRQGDVLKVEDLKDATVVLLYMGDDINQRLRPILQKTLKPGARIVSHRFLMGDWRPERTVSVDSKAGYTCQIHLWEIKGGKD
jgi:tRNA A58 N-methylase Trm61